MGDDLKEKEELYRTLVENSMDALIVCDGKLNFIYTSPSTERLFGYRQDELIGRNAFDFFHPDDIIAHKKRLKMLLTGKEFPSIEFRVRKKDGDYVWCDIATKAIQNTQGDNRIVVVAREFTERKKVEEALRISEGRYKGITESMADTMLEANLSGRITYINHLMPGLTREQVLASTVFDFVPPNQVPVVKKALEGVFERGEVTTYESLGPGPNGESRIYEVRVSPIYAEDKVISAVFLARDITERKKVEEALRISEGRYKGITESMADTMLEANLSGRITYINHLMPGLTREQVLASTVFDFVPPNQVPVVKKALEGVFERGEVTTYESLGPGPNGESRIYEVRVSPIYAEDKVISAVFLARDITERKEMQEKLRKYSENLEELVAQRTAELNKTKEYLEQLISRLPLALVAWDKDFKIRTGNPEAIRMFGFSEQEFLEISSENLFLPTQASSPVNRIWNQLLKDGQANFVGENITKDGKTIICNWKNMLLRDENGNPDGVLSMIQDVTEKKKLEERLKDIAYSLSGVRAGESYLITSTEHSLKIAFDLNSQGVKGLFIVRENPDSLIKNYNFKPEDIVLLSQKPIKDFQAINDLQEIAILITKFLKKSGGVVVLGGLEYLISRSGFNPVFMMIQEKRFEFLETGATLLVPVNMETLDTREKGLLTSELKLLS